MRRIYITLLLSLASSQAFAQLEFANVSGQPWKLPDINPNKPQLNIFYYGILSGNKIYISTVHDGGEAEIGSRAGGHFKILREKIRAESLAQGDSQEIADEKALEAQRKQGQKKEKFHDAIPFGFKIVMSPELNKPVVKWHGWNSFKSTIGGTSTASFSSFTQLAIVEAVQKKYGVPGVMAHPILDPDLTLNPKYIELGDSKYRGEELLWLRTTDLAKLVDIANKKLGHSNVDVKAAAIRIARQHKDACGATAASMPVELGAARTNRNLPLE